MQLFELFGAVLSGDNEIMMDYRSCGNPFFVNIPSMGWWTSEVPLRVISVA